MWDPNGRNQGRQWEGKGKVIFCTKTNRPEEYGIPTKKRSSGIGGFSGPGHSDSDRALYSGCALVNIHSISAEDELLPPSMFVKCLYEKESRGRKGSD